MVEFGPPGSSLADADADADAAYAVTEAVSVRSWNRPVPLQLGGWRGTEPAG